MLSQQVLSPALIVVCVVMVLAAALIYWLAALGSPWAVPWAAIRAAVQLAAVAGVLAAALARLWSSILVLVVMFVVACVAAAQRSQASRGSPLLTAPLALGMLAVLPLLLLSGVVPLTGVAVVPIVAIVLGNTMTAVSVAARLALDTLKLRAGEVEAALSLGMSERDREWRSSGKRPPTPCYPIWTRPEPSAWSPFREPSSAYCSAPDRPLKPLPCKSSFCSRCCSRKPAGSPRPSNSSPAA